MKKITIPLFGILSILLTSCATVKEEVIIPTNTQSSAISPTQTTASLNKKYLKRKIAIGRFSNETIYGQGFFIDKSNDRIGKQAMDILSSKLFETGRFIMLERADISKIEKELSIGNNSTLKNAADFIIVGSITEFGRKEVSDVGVFSRVKKQEASAKVHIRIIDVITGQIIYSEQGKGVAYSEAGTVFGVGNKAGYDSSLNDKVLDIAITDLASNVIENMLGKPWRSYILSYEDNMLIISGGKSQNIVAGTNFEVIRQGKKVKNPQTGMFITLPGKVVATIKVSSSLGDTPESEVSLAKIIDGNITSYIKTQDYSQLFIQEIK